MKVCKRCGERKPLDRFRPDRRCQDGHVGVCLNCHTPKPSTANPLPPAELARLRSLVGLDAGGKPLLSRRSA